MIENVFKNLQWLGHDAFLLCAGGKKIYFDPFQLAPGLPPADIICISHDHYDHCSPADVDLIQQPSTQIVTEAESAKKLQGKIITLAPGERCEVEGLTIETVPAYNTNKQFHPQANGWLGFILTVDGVRVYHAGDTDYIPEMKNIRADIALLPVSGTYTMTAEEAAQAALAIGPKIAVPMHYDAIVGSSEDANRFAAALAGRIRVELIGRK
ncbi:MBL fold metallo-hydrolase [Thiovibrio frasassiensis]|uniref:MBL fold metallo-hydrolase n=1 Tax=Thiovibrio frasassiensis TaxID=2984131 RepID=A0A9X4MG47_9BACT|nr:MBL fold metallo-hydrolase [Thiovibrio frasassiensis]MDG4475240.1 MBL fold metallo-hydrolase [Thiovibrio frasassiensis]